MRLSYARLSASSREVMEFTFEPVYQRPTAGGSAWSIYTRGLRIKLTVPTSFVAPPAFLTRLQARIQPFIFVEQYIPLQRLTVSEYEGEVLLPLYLRGGSSGQVFTHHQQISFDRWDNGFNEDKINRPSSYRLFDPISQSTIFQTDMFMATPYATTDMGLWDTLG